MQPNWVTNDQLMVSLSEQLKMPLLQIARANDLSAISNGRVLDEKLNQTIKNSTMAGLKLIDSYLLNIELQRSSSLDLEPVSLASVMYDSAEVLDSFARAYNCKLELHISGKYGPVVGRYDALKAAIQSLGLGLIEAVSNPDRPATIKLVTRRSRLNIMAGLYFGDTKLSRQLLVRAKQLAGRARQPLGELGSGSGIGVFVAEALLSQLDYSLVVSRHKLESGLGVSLRSSQQLSLV